MLAPNRQLVVGFFSPVFDWGFRAWDDLGGRGCGEDGVDDPETVYMKSQCGELKHPGCYFSRRTPSWPSPNDISAHVMIHIQGL